MQNNDGAATLRWEVWFHNMTSATWVHKSPWHSPLCTVWCYQKSPHQSSAGNSPTQHRKSTDTDLRHTQPHRENGFDPYNISKPESTECHRNQAPICNSVTSRKLWMPEMLSCPATSQTLAYRNLYPCINCIMQSSLALRGKKIILNNVNDYNSIESSKVWRDSLSFLIKFISFYRSRSLICNVLRNDFSKFQNSRGLETFVQYSFLTVLLCKMTD